MEGVGSPRRYHELLVLLEELQLYLLDVGCKDVDLLNICVGKGKVLQLGGLLRYFHRIINKTCLLQD